MRRWIQYLLALVLLTLTALGTYALMSSTAPSTTRSIVKVMPSSTTTSLVIQQAAPTITLDDLQLISARRHRASRSGTRLRRYRRHYGTSSAPVFSDSNGLPGGLLCIRHFESTDNYASVSGIYYGAYQYTVKTWNNYKGFRTAAQAPPNIQDERALSDYNLGPAHRHQEWPQTSRRCRV